jgi:hypothetical protein
MDSVTILCNEQDPTDVILGGVGKLHINTGCKGYTTTALLQTSLTITGNSTLKGGDLLTQIPLQYDCCEELGIKFNISNLPLELKFKETVSHLDDFKYASFKISELEKEIGEQEWKNHHVKTHTSYSIIVYIILAVISMYMLYKLYMYIRRRWTKVARTKSITTSPREMQVSTESSGQGNTFNINIKTSSKSLAMSPEAIPIRGSSQSLQNETSPQRSLRPRVAKSYF